MFRRIAVAALVLPLFAGSVDADKKEGLAYLERTRAGVVESTKGLSEAQWKFKPAADRWSVAEVLEHIAITEGFIFGHLQDVMKAPAGGADRDVKGIDKIVMTMIADRSQKAQAPQEAQPKNMQTPKESLNDFLSKRETTVEFFKSTPGLRDHVADSPIGQKLDAHQWVLFIAAHSERHTKQILEVKADPNFPKK